jgi:chromate transporter
VADAPSPAPGELWRLARIFLRLGATSFGGPAAHIAVMEDELVRRRGWVDRDEFLALLGATNLIPGPNSTELAMHLGQRRAGGRGLIVAGLAFILPAALITAALAWAYVRFGARPEVGAVLYGLAPVMIAVIGQALWGLTPRAVKTVPLGVIGALALAAAIAGVDEVAILACAGALAVAVRPRPRGAPPAALFAPMLAAAPTALPVIPFSLLGLFLFVLKVGAVLFGSGYVLLAFLRADLVEHWHWLTERQLLDAIAVGQVTPGPVFTTATFIGYLLGGGAGAVLATVGIFAPAFAFVAASGYVLPRLRAKPTFAAFLDGVNVASLALMALVAALLGRAALVDAPTIVLAVASAVLLVRFRLNSLWLVILGAAVGGLKMAIGAG